MEEGSGFEGALLSGFFHLSSVMDQFAAALSGDLVRLDLLDVTAP